MKSETLQLIAPLTDPAAVNVARLLNSIEGVSETVAIDKNVSVSFDQDITSTQVLRAVLQRAGFEVQKPVHGEDSVCCGSCS